MQIKKERKNGAVPFERRMQLHFAAAPLSSRKKYDYRKLDLVKPFNFFLRHFFFYFRLGKKVMTCPSYDSYVANEKLAARLGFPLIIAEWITVFEINNY